MTLQIVHTSGSNTTLEVNKDVFGVKPNEILLAQAVYVYQSNQRQGTSKVKTRGEINRTKKKWYKQKGTGGARHGARSPSIFVGGGVSHGPTGMSDWSRELTKSQRRKALIYALSMKAQDKALMVSDELENLSAKTKKTAAFLEKVVGSDQKRILVVLHDSLENVLRSTRNITNVLVTQADRLNVYEMMLADKILMTKEAVKKLEIKLGDKKAVFISVEPADPVEPAEPANKTVALVAKKSVAKKAVTKKPEVKKQAVARKPRTVKVKSPEGTK